MDLTELRREVLWANKMLPAAGLVTMHSGNASGLDRRSGQFWKFVAHLSGLLLKYYRGCRNGR